MKLKKITPQTLLNLFDHHNIAIVNSLGNDIHINKTDLNTSNCFGKDFIDLPKSKLKKFNLVVVYCANYTCPASHTYAVNLINKCEDLTDKVLLYEGGINEWAMLSLTFKNTYSIYNSEKNRKLEKLEIEKQFLKMNHRNESTKNTKYPEIVLENQNLNLDLKFSKNSNSNEMEGKVCVVTGGTSGLGLEVAKKLLINGAKHVTCTFYNNTQRASKVKKELETKFGKDRIYILRADARTVEGNKLTFDLNLRKKKLKIDVGPIHCVDINAGIFGPANLHKKHIFNISEKDYHKTIDTNLTGYFLSMKYFTQQAIKNQVRNASIVCIKSIYGSTGSLFSNTAYQTSKHGVLGLVHQSAVELARPNDQFKLKYPIRVNAVSPTFTTTALTKPFLMKSKIERSISKSNPSSKLALKSDVAEAVIFLMSDKSTSITGIDLPVDCGVLAESIPNYEEVDKLNKSGIEELSCCGESV